MNESPRVGVVTPPLVPFASRSATTAPPGAREWRSLTGLTRALSVLFVIAGALAAWGVVALANRIIVVGDRNHAGDYTQSLRDRAEQADDWVSSATIPYVIVLLAIIVVLIIWLWRAAKNAEALGRDQPRLAPAWAIAGWFIPLANFVLPVLVVQDVWRASNADIPRGDMRWRISDRSALVGWWWACCLAQLARLGWGDDAAAARADLVALRASDALALAGMCAGVAAAVLGILVVRKVEQRQRATLEAQRTARRATTGQEPPA